MRSLKSLWAHKHDQPDMKYSKMILMSVNAMEIFQIIPQIDDLPKSIKLMSIQYNTRRFKVKSFVPFRLLFQ